VRLRARWVDSKRTGWRGRRTSRRSPISPAIGSIRLRNAAQANSSCWIWTRALARRMAGNSRAFGMATSAAHATIRSSSFNQYGDLERCALRPGNVHSADGWEAVLKPVVARYKHRQPASPSAATPPSLSRACTSSSNRRASSTRSAFPPMRYPGGDRSHAQAAGWAAGALRATLL
jgi:hypothetical protein